jgi:hypothetical protein
MLEQLEGLPAGVIGFEAVGRVEADDYEKLLRPAVDAAASTGRIRVVYVLGDRFDGFSAGAALQDSKVGLAHRKEWDRVALVSDADWVQHVAGMFGWIIPGEFKCFHVEQLDDAIAWAAGDGP